MANTKVTGDLIASSTIATGNIADNAVTSDKISGITTAHITEGSNLYYTDARADARVALVVDSAPSTLNTLNELADALGDDPNFATTTANSIGTKLPLAGGTLTGGLTGTTANFTGGTGASASPLIIGSSNQTSYTLQQWQTSSHGTNEAYIIAYGDQHGSRAGDFAIKNIEAGGEIFFELASGVLPLTLTSSGATFAGDVMPAAENAQNIGSASVRWEDLYVDDGFIRDAYIDTNIYHNGDTDTYINFTADTIKLSTAGGFGFELDSNRDINSPDRLYMRQTRFGYSGSYKVVQFGNAAATSGISLGYNPVNNTNGGFSGNEILIPNNIRILAPNAADNQFYGVMMFDDDDKLLIGSSNYLIDSNYIMAMDPATKNVGIGTASPSELLHLKKATGDPRIKLETGGGGDPGIIFQSANNRTGEMYFQDGSTSARFSYNHSNESFNLYAHNQTSIDFHLSETTAYFPTQNVGIGTTSPSAKLQVNDAVYSQIRMHSDHGYSVNRNWRFMTNNFGNGNWGGFSIDSSSTQGGTSYTPKFGIDVNGRVGIGTTSPSAQLHLYNAAASATPMLQVMSHAAAAGSFTGNYMVEFCHAFSGVNHGMLIKNNEAAAGRNTLDVADANGVFATFVNGKVGIGTTSPANKLHIRGGSNTEETVLKLDKAVTSDSGGHMTILGLGTESGSWSKGGIGFERTGAYDVGKMHFLMHPTGLNTNTVGLTHSRMTINNNGNVLIGATDLVSSYDAHAICRDSPSGYALIVKNSNTSTTNNTVMQLNRVETTATTGGYALIYRQGNASTGTNRMIVFANGNIQNTNNSYGSFSDERKKENIVDATPKLDELMKVKVRNFNLIGEETKQIGVVAQELEQVFPSMIDEAKEPDSEDETLYKSVKYSVFVPMLIKAIQELKAEVETLKTQINN